MNRVHTAIRALAEELGHNLSDDAIERVVATFMREVSWSTGDAVELVARECLLECNDNRISAIKLLRVRSTHFLGLKEARDIIERVYAR